MDEKMEFGAALTLMRMGARLFRRSWNAPGQWVVYQAGYPEGIALNANTAKATGLPEGTEMRFQPYLMLKNAQDDFVPWAPTQPDVLASDWAVAE